MKLFETIKLLARGLIVLGRGAGAPPPEKDFGMRAVPFGEKLPVYSLKSPAPVWQGGAGMKLAPVPVEYPALAAERAAAIREDIAETVYRRIGFDSRLVSQPMDEEG
jgi:hypothetical protein